MVNGGPIQKLSVHHSKIRIFEEIEGAQQKDLCQGGDTGLLLVGGLGSSGHIKRAADRTADLPERVGQQRYNGVLRPEHPKED